MQTDSLVRVCRDIQEKGRQLMVFQSACLLSHSRRLLFCLNTLLRSTLFGDWCTARTHQEELGQVWQILEQDAIAVVSAECRQLLQIRPAILVEPADAKHNPSGLLCYWLNRRIKYMFIDLLRCHDFG